MKTKTSAAALCLLLAACSNIQVIGEKDASQINLSLGKFQLPIPAGYYEGVGYIDYSYNKPDEYTGWRPGNPSLPYWDNIYINHPETWLKEKIQNYSKLDGYPNAKFIQQPTTHPNTLLFLLQNPQHYGLVDARFTIEYQPAKGKEPHHINIMSTRTNAEGNQISTTSYMFYKYNYLKNENEPTIRSFQ